MLDTFLSWCLKCQRIIIDTTARPTCGAVINKCLAFLFEKGLDWIIDYLVWLLVTSRSRIIAPLVRAACLRDDTAK